MIRNTYSNQFGIFHVCQVIAKITEMKPSSKNKKKDDDGEFTWLNILTELWSTYIGDNWLR